LARGAAGIGLMNMRPDNVTDLNRREFLRGGSFATLMTLMGGVPIKAAEDKKEEQPANADGTTNYTGERIPVKVGVVGCGLWAREILKTLSLLPNGPVVAICDTYGPYLKRAGDQLAPKAERFDDYRKLLESKEVQGVIVATPSHLHKDIVLAALAAGKHVYCEAPMATSIEDARAIAQAAKAASKLNFQVGLQNRADKQLLNLCNFVRTGVMGKVVKGRAQFHKKTSWRLTSPNADREKEINWRLSKELSLGMVGELGIHQVDVATWYLMGRPVSVTGFGALIQWKDGRDVPDTIEAVFEYPGGVYINYEGTLGNSFDAETSMFYGTDCAIMMRDRRAWMFKEVDAPLLGWEVYAKKDAFYKESGIVLGAGATKQDAQKAKPTQEVVDEKSALQYCLESFLHNSNLIGSGVEDFAAAFDIKDTAALKEYLAALEKNRLPAAGYKEGHEAAVAVIKANEAIVKGQKVLFQKEWFEVG
jgi:predicted dehydrogenase